MYLHIIDPLRKTFVRELDGLLLLASFVLHDLSAFAFFILDVHNVHFTLLALRDFLQGL